MDVLSPGELVAAVRAKGGAIWAESGRVHLEAPRRVLPDELVRTISARRVELGHHLAVVRLIDEFDGVVVLQYPPAPDGWAWLGCTTCGERQLVRPATAGKHRCVMTPKCKGRLDHPPPLPPDESHPSQEER